MNGTLPAADAAPEFDVRVPDSGYEWWYVDGISEDGSEGVVVIAFIGSVFSPYYFHARRHGPAPALDYCAINVGLYRRRGKLWAMTERGRHSVEQETHRFRVGPSSVSWKGNRLEIEINERAMPLGQPLEGRIVLHPAYLNRERFALDPGGIHSWRPIAPAGRIEVSMSRPSLHWQGAAYFDSNRGSRPLEQDFDGWNWSRHGSRGAASITYSADLLDGGHTGLALDFDARGRLSRNPVPPEVRLPTTGWRIDRRTRSTGQPRVKRTLEDTPFYARSLLEVPTANGSPEIIMHESLSLRRFKTAWVRTLLPFRMPRRARRTRAQN